MAGRFSGNSRGGRSFLHALGFSSPLPPVTTALIIVCVVVYILGLFIPSINNAFLFAPILGASEPYRFLTAAFLHGGFWHIVFNMYALALMGNILEPILGKWRFLALYILSALAGNVLVLLLASPTSSSWITGVVGASGAVFGLFGALLILTRHIGADTKGILIIIGLNLVIGFLPGANISWQGHLGGLIMGIVMTLALIARHPNRMLNGGGSRNNQTSLRSTAYDVTIFVLGTLALIALVFWAYH